MGAFIHAGLGGEVDGLTWPSSILGGGRCVVLWESAEDSMPTNPDLNLALADPGLGRALGAIAEQLGYGLI